MTMMVAVFDVFAKCSSDGADVKSFCKGKGKAVVQNGNCLLNANALGQWLKKPRQGCW